MRRSSRPAPVPVDARDLENELEVALLMHTARPIPVDKRPIWSAKQPATPASAKAASSSVAIGV